MSPDSTRKLKSIKLAVLGWCLANLGNLARESGDSRALALDPRNTSGPRRGLGQGAEARSGEILTGGATLLAI